MDPRQGGACLLEAGDGVDVTAFSNITGQVVQAKILEAYTQEAFVLSKLVEHDSHPARRRADSGHRPHQRRGGRGAARHALSQPGLRRGLHRHAADHQARVHRAGDQGGRSSSTART